MPNRADTTPVSPLRVGGLARWTSIDFPGRLAAVVFCQGCPWRCSYCHNPDLLDPGAGTPIAWQEVLDFLHTRRGLLDGVVFSGGEPTLQAGLAEAIAQVRALGFQAALHTGGMYPERLAHVLPLLDWVGLDIKAPWHAMDAITGAAGSARRVRASLSLLVDSGVDFECRTTWAPDLFDTASLQAIGAELHLLGVRHWAVQERRGGAHARLSRGEQEGLAGVFPGFVLRAG